MSDFDNFLRDMVDYYDDLDYRIERRKPESSVIRDEIERISKKWGIPIFREGTNRTIFEDNGYVYKMCHKRGANYDNIREKENSEYAKRNQVLLPHLALGERFIGRNGGAEYILEEEYITPLHEYIKESNKITLPNNYNEGDESLSLLIDWYEDYEYLINILSKYFILIDATPRSIFNYGLKTVTTDRGGETFLAILDHGYFIPIDGDILCPNCEHGILKYDVIDLRTSKNKNKEDIIDDIKTSTVPETYSCSDPECKISDEKYFSEEVGEMYEAGKLQIVRAQRNGNYNRNSSYTRSYSSGNNYGYNR